MTSVAASVDKADTPWSTLSGAAWASTRVSHQPSSASHSHRVIRSLNAPASQAVHAVHGTNTAMFVLHASRPETKSCMEGIALKS